MFGLSAVAVAGIAAAAAGAYAAHQSSNAAKDAANAQMTGQENAIQTQQMEFNTINNEYAPQRNLGYGADTLLAQLFGVQNPMTGTGFTGDPKLNASSSAPALNYDGTPRGGGTLNDVTNGKGGGLLANSNISSVVGGGGSGSGSGSGSGTPDYSAFYNSPNYQFALTQGEQAINRNAAAGGGAFSTTTMGNLDKFAAGTASQQYQSYVANLLSMAGLGSTATQGTANAAMQTGANISNAQIGIGNANASGILGSTAADNQMWKSIIGGISSFAGGFGGGTPSIGGP